MLPDLTVPTITITAWPDAVIDAVGHDPRSTYVEMFWLSILGPSTTWLLRRLVTGLDRHPDGYELPLAQTASALGPRQQGRPPLPVRAEPGPLLPVRRGDVLRAAPGWRCGAGSRR